MVQRTPAAPGRNQSLTPSRKLAQGILVRVAEDAAHASPLLDSAISRGQLGSQDAAWLTELVYGTLRHGAQLEQRLQRYLHAPFARLPVPVQCALRAAAYQIVHMRVPAYTAVDATVELLRRPFGKLAGVANAVLRRLAEEADLAEQNKREGAETATAGGPELAQVSLAPGAQAVSVGPAPNDISAEALAQQESHPLWLVRRWLEQLGVRETRALLQANNLRPPLSLRVNTRRTSPVDFLARLQAAGFAALASPVLAEGILLRRAGEVRRLPGYVEGHFVVQDMAPALVSHLLQVEPHDTVIDLCAAPGGKTTHIAELLGGTGQVLAIDSHAGRLGLVVKNATRLGHGNVVPVLADASNPTDLAQALREAGVRHPVRCVLLDPPCTGTGTLRRHPELRQRDDARLEVLVALQADMLRNAAELIAVGGRLVYAVCSVIEEEGAQQIDAFLAAHKDFTLAPLPQALAAYGEERRLRTWPHRHDLDGFFAACLVRSH